MFNRNWEFNADEDGFILPHAGGPLGVRFNQTPVSHTDTTAVKVFTLPRGAVPVKWVVKVTEAFDDTGTDLLSLGTDTTADAFAADLDVSAIGQILDGFDVDAMFGAAEPLPWDTPICATFTGENGDASAGLAFVGCIYALM